MNDSHVIGERLREGRKRRGLTQRDLAQSSGVSLSLIKKLEQGDYGGVGTQTLRKLAAALGVATTVLLAGDRLPAGPGPESATWEPLQRVLAEPGHGSSDPELVTAEGVAQSLAGAVKLYHGNRYGDLAVILPGLLRDAEAVSPLLRSQVFQLTGSLLVQTRQRDAARIALDRCMADAQASGSLLDTASCVITQCWLLLLEQQFGQVLSMAVDWADRVEPRLSSAPRAEISAWGWLLLRASAAAIRDNRPGEAAGLMRLAEAAATVIGPEHGSYHAYWTTFGPATVAMKKVENAVVDGRPGLALRLAANVPAGLRPTSDNRNRHLLDVAAAHLDLRQHAAAADVLIRLSLEAPTWLASQHMARNLLAGIIARRRTLTPQMRELANTMRLPL